MSSTLRVVSVSSLAFALIAAVAAVSASASPILNLEDFVREMNLTTLYGQPPTSGVGLRIAVLDNGFDGWQDAVTQGALPKNTQYHAGPVDPPAPDPHGRVMAELMYGLLTHDGKAQAFQPAELHLYNAYGFSNFQAAIQDVVARHIDLVLYAQNWEYGGNLDGHGFIDAAVGQATSAGVLWVNSSGDFGETTFNAPVIRGSDDWASLPGPNQSVEVRCEDNPSGSCSLRLVLSWNAFNDDPNIGTTKDLDLILTDDTLNIVASSQLIQTDQPTNQPGYSLYPREIIETDIKPGLYYARVKIRSTNFGNSDRLRMTASGDFVTLPDHDPNESLLVPADRPDVISVGALDTARSSHSQSLGKPDISVNSLIQLSSTEQYQGTSSASAAVAAGIALLKALHPDWERTDLLQALKSQIGFGAPDPVTGLLGPGQGIAPILLDFGYTVPGCFLPLDPDQVAAPPYVRSILAQGGILVLTTRGQKIMLPYDPLVVFPQIHRVAPNDMIVVGPAGPGLLPRADDPVLPAGLYEIIQLPLGAFIGGYAP